MVRKHPEALPLPSHQPLSQLLSPPQIYGLVSIKKSDMGLREAVVIETRMVEALGAGKGDTVVLGSL